MNHMYFLIKVSISFFASKNNILFIEDEEHLVTFPWAKDVKGSKCTIVLGLFEES